MHNIHAGDITRKEYANVFPYRIIHILFQEQTVWKVNKLEKGLLDKCG